MGTQRGHWRPGRQTLKVRDGRVQKKHRWEHYFKEYDLLEGQAQIPIVVEPVIRRFRQPVETSDLRSFVELVPDWERHSEGLKCLVLGDGDHDCFGWHDDGVICLDAWEGYEQDWRPEFFEEHRAVLDRLLVSHQEDEDEGVVRCVFTRKTACAFQLMHVFLQELVHHHVRMPTRGKLHSPSGEQYAENFVERLAEEMWSDFFRVFGM